jgi:hypothetical protein
MLDNWYYAKGDEKFGPFTREELQQKADSGTLTREDLIWRDGLDEWKPAASLKGLFKPESKTDGPGVKKGLDSAKQVLEKAELFAEGVGKLTADAVNPSQIEDHTEFSGDSDRPAIFLHSEYFGGRTRIGASLKSLNAMGPKIAVLILGWFYLLPFLLSLASAWEFLPFKKTEFVRIRLEQKLAWRRLIPALVVWILFSAAVALALVLILFFAATVDRAVNKAVDQLANAGRWTYVFNSEDLTGWHGDTAFWSVENGELIGKSTGDQPRDLFLILNESLDDFELYCEFQLVGAVGNSGIHISSTDVESDGVKGYQVNLTYEDFTLLRCLIDGEGLDRNELWLTEKSKTRLRQAVNQTGWNSLSIKADGRLTKIQLNEVTTDVRCVPQTTKSVAIALQLAGSQAMEVRFRDFKVGRKRLAVATAPLDSILFWIFFPPILIGGGLAVNLFVLRQVLAIAPEELHRSRIVLYYGFPHKYQLLSGLSDAPISNQIDGVLKLCEGIAKTEFSPWDQFSTHGGTNSMLSAVLSRIRNIG